MKTITWSTSAQEDLQQLYDFYISLNENAAVRLYNEVIREAEILSSFPYLGPQEPLLQGRKFCYRSLTTPGQPHLILFVVSLGSTIFRAKTAYGKSPSLFFRFNRPSR
ncbi:MAG: type II toxin-antitoxin system RelE/ParE family toxin [Tannerella sp.]|jgi:plasmid stabilization system protein ParE|nr:type II toxin-antitoxin system RelE/ParE family toxin [Tannerella sp.]